MGSNGIYGIVRGRVASGREVGDGGRDGWARVSRGASTSYRAHRSGVRYWRASERREREYTAAGQARTRGMRGGRRRRGGVVASSNHLVAMLDSIQLRRSSVAAMACDRQLGEQVLGSWAASVVAKLVETDQACMRWQARSAWAKATL